jgi:peroxiredoxin
MRSRAGKRLPLFGTLLLLAGFAGCMKTPQPEAKLHKENERKAAPNFSLKDANGQNVTMAEYKGKVVLLNFWATWCAPCKEEIPWFMEFENQYKDRGFAVLGVSFDDDGWKSVRPYIEKSKINYRIMVGESVVGEQYGGIDSLPTTFIIDRQGKVATSHIGLAEKRDYQNEILVLLNDPKPSARIIRFPGLLASFGIRPTW